jgi:UDP-N-acetylglucosamine acyltransferase
MKNPGVQIHPSAVVDPTAKLGQDVVIGPFAVIGADVIIGDRSRVISHAVLEHTELGAECVVYPYVTLGMAPQHLRYAGEKTRLVVGARTTFRESVTAHRGTPFDSSVTKIGDDCYFMALSHVAHDCVVGNKVIMANAAQLAGHVQVGDGCFISSTVGVHQFVRIGKGSLVSGGSMVSLDVAPYCIAQGDRAYLRGLNVVGLRRLGAKRETISALRAAYKALFLCAFSLSDAPTPELPYFTTQYLTRITP